MGKAGRLPAEVFHTEAWRGQELSGSGGGSVHNYGRCPIVMTGSDMFKTFKTLDCC